MWKDPYTWETGLARHWYPAVHRALDLLAARAGYPYKIDLEWLTPAIAWLEKRKSIDDESDDDITIAYWAVRDVALGVRPKRGALAIALACEFDDETCRLLQVWLDHALTFVP